MFSFLRLVEKINIFLFYLFIMYISSGKRLLHLTVAVPLRVLNCKDLACTATVPVIRRHSWQVHMPVADQHSCPSNRNVIMLKLLPGDRIRYGDNPSIDVLIHELYGYKNDRGTTQNIHTRDQTRDDTNPGPAVHRSSWMRPTWEFCYYYIKIGYRRIITFKSNVQHKLSSLFLTLRSYLQHYLPL